MPPKVCIICGNGHSNSNNLCNNHKRLQDIRDKTKREHKKASDIITKVLNEMFNGKNFSYEQKAKVHVGVLLDYLNK